MVYFRFIGHYRQIIHIKTVKRGATQCSGYVQIYFIIKKRILAFSHQLC